jgi:hypothetical protein
MKGLLSIADAARKYGIKPKTLLRRLKGAADTFPELLVNFAPAGARVGRWYVREVQLRRLIDGGGESRVEE